MSSLSLTPVTNARAVAKQGSVEASRSGIWAGTFAITMTFAALSSALFVREGSAADWQHVVLPRILDLNTLALVLSSFALERSRRFVCAGLPTRTGAVHRAMRWLCVALVLGLAFFAGQLVAWHQLAAEGIVLATNPNSSFFYVLTAMHGIHLFGGLIALGYLVIRAGSARIAFNRSLFDSTAIYWHFMGVLWIYLLLIFRTRL
jgi:cytochrome c oxidase subunit III